MYAEVTIRAKRDLPEDLSGVLARHFPGTLDKKAVVDCTVFGSAPGGYGVYGSRIAHAQLAHQRAALFFPLDSRAFLVHLEHENQHASLGDLGRRVEKDLAPKIEEFLKDDRPWSRVLRAPFSEVSALNIEMFAEKKVVQVGSRQSWRERVVKSAQENFWQKVYVPVATLLASLLFNVGVDRALFNVAVALAALALWVLLNATFVMDRYEVRTVDQ